MAAKTPRLITMTSAAVAGLVCAVLVGCGGTIDEMDPRDVDPGDITYRPGAPSDVDDDDDVLLVPELVGDPVESSGEVEGNADDWEGLVVAIQWDPALLPEMLSSEMAASRVVGSIANAAASPSMMPSPPIGHEVGAVAGEAEPGGNRRFEISLQDAPPEAAFGSEETGTSALAVGTLVAVKPREVYYDPCLDDVWGQVDNVSVLYLRENLAPDAPERDLFCGEPSPGFMLVDHLGEGTMPCSPGSSPSQVWLQRDADDPLILRMFQRPAKPWAEPRCERRRPVN